MKKSQKDLITENDFWYIIEKSLLGKSISNQNKILASIFQNKSKEELIGFCYHATKLYRKAYTSRLWAALYIVGGLASDDIFHYFRCWLIYRGRKVYYDALSNPDTLMIEFEKCKYQDEIHSDAIVELVYHFYSKKYPQQDELALVIENEYDQNYETKGEVEMSETIEFDWKIDDEESLKKLCPQLFNRFWANQLKQRTLS